MRSFLCVLALAACMAAGCEKGPSFQEIDATNTALKADIQAETGHEALISYMKDGSSVTITVQLVSTSSADADAARPKVESAVKRHWPKATKVVVEAQP
jgi:hypothetical protein